MVGKAKKLVRAFRDKVTTPALLAVFLVGTFPHPACICADGHREPLCRVAICRLLGQEMNAGASSACSHCKGTVELENRSCCRVTPSAPAPVGHVSQPSLIAKTGTCCRPFVKPQTPMAAATKVSVLPISTLIAAITPLLFSCAAENDPLALSWALNATPPPLDGIIVFQHLTL